MVSKLRFINKHKKMRLNSQNGVLPGLSLYVMIKGITRAKRRMLDKEMVIINLIISI